VNYNLLPPAVPHQARPGLQAQVRMGEGAGFICPGVPDADCRSSAPDGRLIRKRINVTAACEIHASLA
ncbi:hypothetical protein M9458_035677, partial [Cirrhinus mrigala]